MIGYTGLYIKDLEETLRARRHKRVMDDEENRAVCYLCDKELLEYDLRKLGLICPGPALILMANKEWRVCQLKAIERYGRTFGDDMACVHVTPFTKRGKPMKYDEFIPRDRIGELLAIPEDAK